MPFDIDKYAVIEKKRKISFKRCLKYRKIKFFRSFRKIRKIKNLFKILLKCLAGLFIILFFVFLCLYLHNQYEYYVKYSIPMPFIGGRFFQYKDGIIADGLWVICSKERENSEKTASLYFGEFSCNFKQNICKEELVQIVKLTNIIMFPVINEYEITYRDKNRILYSDNNKTSGVIDINQKTITKTNHKTFLRDEEIVQTDEFIMDYEKIVQEEKEIIKKHLKRG